MKEGVLRDFFTGAASVENLAAHLREWEWYHPLEEMSQDFEVRASHLEKLCDAVLAGSLGPQALEAVGSCLIASSHFHWDGDTSDGDRVANVTWDWSSPYFNYPLTRDNVERWRVYLETGENPFREQPGEDPHSGL